MTSPPFQSGTTWFATGAVALVLLLSAGEPASFEALRSASPEQWQNAEQEILARWLSRVGDAARQFYDDVGSLTAALPAPPLSIRVAPQPSSTDAARTAQPHCPVQVRLALMNLPPPARDAHSA